MSQKTNELWRKPRPIVKRIRIQGDLELLSPAHFGSGDVDPFNYVDMLLLRDPVTGRALLPGASIAGALRNYLRDRELGYWESETNSKFAPRLLGVSKGTTEGNQSPLIVHDALASEGAYIELRDGVAINPQTRTAEEGAKFDLEVLAAGTVFPLTFELVIEKDDKIDENEVRQALVTALQGLEWGDIHLGARKQRGLGQVQVKQWRVWEYDMTTSEGLLAWLTAEQPDIAPIPAPQTGPDIANLLDVKARVDRRHYFNLKVIFALNGAMLIRSGFDTQESGPDTIHLHGRQSANPDDKPQPVIPGTSLAGVIRHQALRVAHTLNVNDAVELINTMFGCADKTDPKKSKASRVRVRDTVIQKTESLVQSRIRIDRFTGGAHHTALFTEQPIFGNKDSMLTLDLTLLNPADREIGLLLQVLKDLWVGDLPVGGSSSVGRGRLQGMSADLTLQIPPENGSEATLLKWQIASDEDKLKIEGDHQKLEGFAETLSKSGGAA